MPADSRTVPAAAAESTVRGLATPTSSADSREPAAVTSAFDFAFIDSGTGGIGYMLHLARQHPEFTCVYVGDTAHFPYGEKTEQEVVSAATELVQLVTDRFHPKAFVVACNTMSVSALSALRAAFPATPFVGTVPAIKLAAEVTRNNRIGLLATRGTVEHPYTQELINNFASHCFVARRGDPELVSFVEHRLFTAPPQEVENVVSRAVRFFTDQDCDTIILGCTHFIHLAPVFERVAGPSVRIVDSRDGVVNQALRVYGSLAKVAVPCVELVETPGTANLSFFCTAATFAQIATQFPAQEAEYRTLSQNLHIPYGGIIR